MHFFKNLINKFKEPMSKHDRKRFIIEGFLGAILFGSLMGALKFFILTTNFAYISILTFIIFYTFMTRRLYKSFSFYHIWYSILAVFFVLLGDYFISVFGHMLLSYYQTATISLAVFNPIPYYRFLYDWPADVMTIIMNIISIITYLFICVLTYIQMKR